MKIAKHTSQGIPSLTGKLCLLFGLVVCGSAAAASSNDYWDDRFSQPGVDSWGRAIAVSNGKVYLGGNFRRAGGVPAELIAEWNGKTWLALGDGMTGGTLVDSLVVNGSNVYAGGYFNIAGDV